MRRRCLEISKLSAQQKQDLCQWLRKARRATRKAIEQWENGEKVEFNQPVWTELKVWMAKTLFGDRCAYCQASSQRGQIDAEHYRPKGAVKYADQDKLKTAMTTMPDGSTRQHPGYFWLAYDLFNLLPSCKLCNSSDWKGETGKREQFPVSGTYVLLRKLSDEQVAKLRQTPYASKRWKGYYYLRPLDLNPEEKPDLVHPILDEPHQHLRFEAGGLIVEQTPRGKQTISVFRLDLGEINGSRQEAQNKAKMYVLAAWMQVKKEADIFDTARANLEPFLSGDEPFSEAALDYLLLNDKFPLEFRRALENARRRTGV